MIYKGGELRQVTVGKTDVLLVRSRGKYYTIVMYTQYSVLLAQWVLSGNHVVCPSHNAYFDITSPNQQEPPGLDSLLSYQVRVEAEKIIVSVPESSGHRQPLMAEYNPVDKRTFVILGAHGGYSCSRNFESGGLSRANRHGYC